jgi:hypothetical protein
MCPSGIDFVKPAIKLTTAFAFPLIQGNSGWGTQANNWNCDDIQKRTQADDRLGKGFSFDGFSEIKITSKGMALINFLWIIGGG